MRFFLYYKNDIIHKGGENMFVIHQGMSGTGKTTVLMEQMSKKKTPVIYLVPDQMSVHTERYITSQVVNKATTNVQVYTFKLLEKQILKQSENQTYTELGTIEQFFILLRILDAQRDQLKTLRYMHQNSAQLEECLELFALWRNQCIDVEVLFSDSVDGKLHDLLLLYRAFMNEQKHGAYFPEEIYRLASKSLEEFSFFDQTTVVIDGFYVFSETEKVMLKYILNQAKEVHMTIPMYMNHELPMQIMQTKMELEQLAQAVNRPIENRVYSQIVRQDETSILHSLVMNLPNTGRKLEGNKADFQLFQAQTIEEEVHEMASLIRQVVMQGNDTYSDCVIYLADMSTYRDKIIDIFRLYDIPVFLDAKENIRYTLLAQVMYLSTELFVQSVNGNRLLALLKTGLIIPLEDVYILEPILELFTLNDAKAFTMTKWEMYCEQHADDAQLKMRFERLQAFVDQLVVFKQKFSKSRRFGEKTEVLLAFLDCFDVFEQLQNQVDATILQLFSTRIDSLYELFKDERLTNEMYAVIVEMIISQLTYLKQPSSQNQVVIADFTRSRVSQNLQLNGGLGAKYVYIPGFIQGAIPPFTPDFTLLQNDDLNDVMRVLLPDKQSQYEMRFMYVYFALAQASQRLTLLYSKRSRGGEENTAHRMFELFSQVNAIDIVQAKSIQQPYAPTHELLETEALLFAPYLEKHAQLKITKEEMHHFLGAEKERVYSVSQFERYNSCPFQYFLEREIGLRDQTQSFTDSRTIGNIIHDFMEQLAKTPIDGIQVDDAFAYAEQFLQTYEQTKLGFSFTNENAYTQLLAYQICQYLSDNMKRYVHFRASAQFIPYATEAIFQVNVNGHKVRGKVDRIDIAYAEEVPYFQVIDYKSSPKVFDWTNFEAGVQMQLPFYLYAKSGLEKKLPPHALAYGFYYQTLKVDYDQYKAETIELNGYTRHDVALISSFTDDLSMYSGMRLKKDGTLSASAKVLTEEQLQRLSQKTVLIAQQTIEHIENNQFPITPLAFEDGEKRVQEPKGCEYCRFQGICQRELLQKNDFRTVKKVDQEESLCSLQNDSSKQ